jgi:integrase
MLTDAAIRAAKPRERPWKLADGEGLYLSITPSGSRLWRFKYRYAGVEKLLSFGGYTPGRAGHVPLAEARERLADAKKMLRDGIDPSAARKAERMRRADRESGSFEAVALEWHAKKSSTWSEGYARKELRQLQNYVLPFVGAKAFRDLTSRDLLEALQPIEQKGRAETAHRVRRSLGWICRYAVATHRADTDVSAALRGALAPVRRKSFASITEPKRVGELLRAIRAYEGTAVVRAALALLPLTFVRPGELRAARWQEFEFNLAEPRKGKSAELLEPQWRIPEGRMKMRKPHIVPLSQQAEKVLRELHAVTGPEGLLFPGVRARQRPISENTINAALRGMGFDKHTMTGHGFRHLASTLLHERGYKSEWVERQLSHGDRDKVRASYDYSQHLVERRRMMQEWADYLDALAGGAAVVGIRAKHGA